MLACSPSRITASIGTTGRGTLLPIVILKLANISDLSTPSGLGISERTTMRRVEASDAAPIALMRALNTRSGMAAIFASMSWPTRTFAMSFSGTFAFSHIVVRSAIE